ncbi:MAG: L-threonylcarbamoyladenylate synthase [Candidatus Aenigmatarchaeota archaeon]
MKIIKFSNKKIKYIVEEAVKVLKTGGLVVYPTETCYGLAADPTNEESVEKLLKFKGKRNKPISIAVCNKKMSKKYVKLNEIAENLYDNYLPGPLTVVSKSLNRVDKRIEGQDGTLGVRIPNHDLVLKIIKSFGKPITSTSANETNKKTPYKIEDILDNIDDKKKKLLDLIIDAGELPKNKPSTVVNTTLNELKILREGDVKLISPTIYISNSVNETMKIANEILDKIEIGKKPIIFGLQGELGSGKTYFTKGIAKALGIKENIISPTFILCREYEFDRGLKLFHIDTYRLFDQKEFIDLGLDKMIQKPNIIVIEWAEKVSKILMNLNVNLIWVKFSYHGVKKRKIEYCRIK